MARTFRRVFFIAMAAALSSCTYQSEVHEAERGIPKASSNPSILEAQCKPGAPVVGLGPAVDARETQVIAWYVYDTSPWWFAGGWEPFPLNRGSVANPHEVTIGPELAEYANDALANCLTAKGYCVQRDPHSSLVPQPARLVGLGLLSADTKNTSSLDFGSPLHRNRAAEIKTEVRDSSSQKGSFVSNYSSVHAMDSVGFSTFFSWSGTDAPFAAHYVDQVNKAIDDAVQKACDDPAFIAAIAPPSGPKPR